MSKRLLLPATAATTREWVRRTHSANTFSSGISRALSHRAIWVAIASSALSGCLVVAPKCDRCPVEGSANDGGPGSDVDAASVVEETSQVTTSPSGEAPDTATDDSSSLPADTNVSGATGGSTDDQDSDSDSGGGGTATVPTSEGEPSADSGGSSALEPGTSTSGAATDVGSGVETSSPDTAPVDTSSPDTSETSNTSTPVPSTDTSAPLDTSSDPDTTSDSDSTEPPAQAVHEVLWEENFEDGWAGWTVEGDTWTLGTPSSGDAPTAKNGSKLVGTGLEAPYHRENSRLISPQFVVPPAHREPYLRYWYWYALEADDTVQVQVRVGEEVNWVDIRSVTDTISTVAGQGGQWLQGILPLDRFGDEAIQLSFAMSAEGENCSVAGFFVDKVSLETGPMDICSCQGFDNGNVGDWSIEGGQWAIGPSNNAEAPDPFDGEPAPPGLAGTNLFGPYASLAGAPVARLASPTYKVADEWRHAKFYYWHSFATGGRAKIQLRVLGEPWQDLPGREFMNASAEGWTELVIELDPWIGEVIQLGFLLENGGGVGGAPTTPGFYIDEFNFN